MYSHSHKRTHEVDSDHHYIPSLANAALSHGRFVAAFQAKAFVQTEAAAKGFVQRGSSSQPRCNQPFATHRIGSQVVGSPQPLA